MKNLGYYYSPKIKTIIIGFIDKNNKLNGKVIGNTFLNSDCVPFSCGYKYDRWYEGFLYIGKLSTYTSFDGYMSFLKDASYDQIKSYFLCKSVIIDKHNSYVSRKVFDGRTIKYIIPKLPMVEGDMLKNKIK